MLSYLTGRSSANPQKEAGAQRQSFFSKINSHRSRFSGDENGAIAMILGLLFIPLITVIFVSMEFSNAYGLRNNTQQALDAATIAAGRLVDQGKTQDEAKAIAQDVFASNLNNLYSGTSHYTMGQAQFTFQQNGDIYATHESSVKSSILNLVGSDHINVKISSTVVTAQREVEIVMVLDNSGSMGSDMSDLRKASCNLVRIIYGEEAEASESDACTAFTASQNELRIRMALVPFSVAVNIGASNSGAAWMDSGANSSIHKENFMYPSFTMSGSLTSSGNSETYSSSADLASGTASQALSPIDGVTGSARAIAEYNAEFPTRNRWSLFNNMNVSWGGCPEVRPGIHGTKDTTPDVSDPDTLFVPMFAPDEPDDLNSSSQNSQQNIGQDGSYYNNNYIKDRPNSCPQPVAEVEAVEAVEGQEEIRSWGCKRYYRRGRNRGQCREWGWIIEQEAIEAVEGVDGQPAIDVWLSPEKAQAVTCKYTNSDKHGSSSYGSNFGPNFFCKTKPVTPLTADTGILLTNVKAMSASGWTNITEGLMWGWRVLSPGAPFTESQHGAQAGDAVDQILILMTDGRNEMAGRSNHNNSDYFPWGYGAKGRLDPNANTNDAINAAMNVKLAEACTNIAADTNIQVYTVGYNLNDDTTKGLLENCAGALANNRHFLATSGNLDAQFQAIANQISDLRIAK